MKKLLFSIIVCMFFPVAMFAQIGYQVSLLNSATGEPRANERVSVTVEITNSEGEAIFSSTQNTTSNDFGIISLTIGNADTFKDVDWGKLPFFIAVTIEGKLIAKSQMLSVPIAEVANTLKSDFTLEELCGKTWDVPFKWGKHIYYMSFDFDSNGMFKYNYTRPKESFVALSTGYSVDSDFTEVSGIYEIEGNNIYLYVSSIKGANFVELSSSILRYNNNGMHFIGFIYPLENQGI